MTFAPFSTAAPRIVVLGSLNMDLVVRVPQAPAGGETVLGRSIDYVPGGKGANQAVSCARQGAAVAMVGAVGDDDHGRTLAASLAADGVELGPLQRIAGVPTGTAVVMVDDSGQNRIVVIGGANEAVDVSEAALASLLRGAAFLVVQFETPMAQVERAIHVAVAAGTPVLLNPSPVAPLSEAMWASIDTLVVNETEAHALSGLRVDDVTQAASAARSLLDRGPRQVVVTLGERGVIAADAAGCRHHPALPTKVVDTTAAGDTFLGALAVSLAVGTGEHDEDVSFGKTHQPVGTLGDGSDRAPGRGADETLGERRGTASSTSLDDAVQLGIRAAALCIAKPGAQPSIPTRDATLASPLPPPWTAL